MTSFYVRASLGFALLTTLASAIGLVISVIVGEVFIGSTMKHTKDLVFHLYYLPDDVNKLNGIVYELAMSLVCLTGGIVSSVSFVLSVLLCNGLRKCKPEQVKLYLVFAGTFAVLVGIGATVHMNAYDAETGRYVLIAYGVYMFFLGVVYITYKKMLLAVTCN